MDAMSGQRPPLGRKGRGALRFAELTTAALATAAIFAPAEAQQQENIQISGLVVPENVSLRFVEAIPNLQQQELYSQINREEFSQVLEANGIPSDQISEFLSQPSESIAFYVSAVETTEGIQFVTPWFQLRQDFSETYPSRTVFMYDNTVEEFVSMKPTEGVESVLVVSSVTQRLVGFGRVNRFVSESGDSMVITGEDLHKPVILELTSDTEALNADESGRKIFQLALRGEVFDTARIPVAPAGASANVRREPSTQAEKVGTIDYSSDWFLLTANIPVDSSIVSGLTTQNQYNSWASPDSDAGNTWFMVIGEDGTVGFARSDVLTIGELIPASPAIGTPAEVTDGGARLMSDSRTSENSVPEDSSTVRQETGAVVVARFDSSQDVLAQYPQFQAAVESLPTIEEGFFLVENDTQLSFTENGTGRKYEFSGVYGWVEEQIRTSSGSVTISLLRDGTAGERNLMPFTQDRLSRNFSVVPGIVLNINAGERYLIGQEELGLFATHIGSMIDEAEIPGLGSLSESGLERVEMNGISIFVTRNEEGSYQRSFEMKLDAAARVLYESMRLHQNTGEVVVHDEVWNGDVEVIVANPSEGNSRLQTTSLGYYVEDGKLKLLVAPIDPDRTDLAIDQIMTEILRNHRVVPLSGEDYDFNTRPGSRFSPFFNTIIEQGNSYYYTPSIVSS